MKTWQMVLILISIVLLTAVPVMAQSDDSSTEEPETAVTGTITGQIINGTNGVTAPGNLEVMLHHWDANYNQKDMTHGQADGDGRFVFDDLSFEPGSLYAVMTTYQDVTYISTPVGVPDGEMVIDLEVPIYETTTETGTIQMDGMHIFFEAGQGTLQVNEVYSLSNLGDRTVAGAASLDDGTPATTRFDLPPEAVNVMFQGSQSRFFFTDDGFADTAPLLPGERTGQVIVSYALPYAGSLTLNRLVPFPGGQISILLPTTLGLSLTGDNLVNEGRRDMGNGLVVDVFTVENAAAFESVSIDLSGELSVPNSDPMIAEAKPVNNQGLAIGGLILGLAVVGVGLWWYRRPLEMQDEAFPEAFDDIVLEIALLDAAYDEQEIDGKMYQVQRTALREQARAILAESGD